MIFHDPSEILIYVGGHCLWEHPQTPSKAELNKISETKRSEIWRKGHFVSSDKQTTPFVHIKEHDVSHFLSAPPPPDPKVSELAAQVILPVPLKFQRGEGKLFQIPNDKIMYDNMKIIYFLIFSGCKTSFSVGLNHLLSFAFPIIAK